jgi:hypothetical protein
MTTASYGWAQPIVRRLCEFDTRNIRFCLEADRPTLHFIGLAIRGWARAGAGRCDLKTLACSLTSQKRRSLLAALWGQDLGSPGLLSRCRGRLWPMVRYDDLAAVLADPERRRVLARLQKLRSKDIVVLAGASADLLQTQALAFLLRHGLTAASYVGVGLARRGFSGDPDAVLECATQDRVLDVVLAALIDEPLPAPPWPGTPAIRPMVTLREVTAAGASLRNCLTRPEIALRVLGGDLALYSVETTRGPACASLKLDRVLASWRLNELRLAGNRALAPATARSIRGAFEAAGFPYLPQNPLAPWYDW